MNKLVCISGCSRGLGKAMAIEFSSRGWTVTGGARDKDSLNELIPKLNTDHFIHPFDITVFQEVKNFSEIVIQKFDHPTCLSIMLA